MLNNLTLLHTCLSFGIRERQPRLPCERQQPHSSGADQVRVPEGELDPVPLISFGSLSHPLRAASIAASFKLANCVQYCDPGTFDWGTVYPQSKEFTRPENVQNVQIPPVGPFN